jgi:hypothetical protein
LRCQEEALKTKKASTDTTLVWPEPEEARRLFIPRNIKLQKKARRKSINKRGAGEDKIGDVG